MFTSRAEFRLHLRIDNADERLTPIGREVGLVCNTRWNLFTKKQEQKARILDLLEKTRTSAVPEIVGLEAATDNPTLRVWLRRPEAKAVQLESWMSSRLGESLVNGVLATVETEAKYEGYLQQQDRQIRRMVDSEGRRIPGDFSYENIPGLSTEVRQKLTRVRPVTLGQAGRIPGVTPAAVSVLDVYLTLAHVSRET
jgi:tRNA uridine 5-carboxymethylaminomethyl modification enzyme